tara:strand:+ start:274 stop:474 length:201 start_codon:yes stop_codon:yes gene_type:complete
MDGKTHQMKHNQEKPIIRPIDNRCVPIESKGELKFWVDAGLRSGYYPVNLLEKLNFEETESKTNET